MSDRPKDIFVFDLDDTIVRTGELSEPLSNEELEKHKVPDVILLLNTLARARSEGKVWIFLLTNNSDSLYVALVDIWLEGKFNSKGVKGYGFFDQVLDRSESSPRIFINNGRDAVKSLDDVRTMLRAVGDPGADVEGIDPLRGRTYFFDDQEGHVLQDQLAEVPGHMFLINPKGGNDFTSLTPIIGPLIQAGGSSAKQKKRKYLCFSRRKRSRRSRKGLKIGSRKRLRLLGPRNSHHAL